MEDNGENVSSSDPYTQTLNGAVWDRNVYSNEKTLPVVRCPVCLFQTLEWTLPHYAGTRTALMRFAEKQMFLILVKYLFLFIKTSSMEGMPALSQSGFREYTVVSDSA